MRVAAAWALLGGWAASRFKGAGHREVLMSPLGIILVVLLIIFLAGGFSGRFGGYGYGFGHGGVGLPGILLIIVVVLLLTGRL